MCRVHRNMNLLFSINCMQIHEAVFRYLSQVPGSLTHTAADMAGILRQRRTPCKNVLRETISIQFWGKALQIILKSVLSVKRVRKSSVHTLCVDACIFWERIHNSHHIYIGVFQGSNDDIFQQLFLTTFTQKAFIRTCTTWANDLIGKLYFDVKLLWKHLETCSGETATQLSQPSTDGLVYVS